MLIQHCVYAVIFGKFSCLHLLFGFIACVHFRPFCFTFFLSRGTSRKNCSGLVLLRLTGFGAASTLPQVSTRSPSFVPEVSSMVWVYSAPRLSFRLCPSAASCKPSSSGSGA